ncbi:hypothetical protein ILUMI_01349 [Ignelater luminosus]|uniref:RNA-directed DNA polymerase n=1 Tax=Ignelater luminosus TaxID=2038154 RepID=A0A8K0DII9_IGNLU|nr:hypothetical protein ILUMI_01349 [Ignelater luminosus]
MDMSSNLHEKWKFWKQKFNTYLKATEICKKSEETQCAQLLQYIGEIATPGHSRQAPGQWYQRDSGKPVQVSYRKCDAAYNQQCRVCFKKGHYKKMCCSKNVQVINCSNDSDDNLDRYENDNNCNEKHFAFVGAINNNTNTKEWNVKMLVNKIKTIQFKIDTGSMVDVLPVVLLNPDDSKIKAILEMPSPTNKKELQRFLGMVTYVGKSIQNFSQITAPLRELLRKDIAWYWNKNKQNVIDYLKTILTSKPVLQYYDINKTCIFSADASKDGLPAVLLQNKMPCAYASKAMTGAQKRYAQIEKELLAILFACEHFYQYIYGKHVVVPTDHGVNKTKNRARQCFYWPGMARDIEKNEPLISHDIPNRSWKKVACDLFNIQRDAYLLVEDYYSKYIEIVKLEDSTSSNQVIVHLKSIFARHAIPDVVMSDNDKEWRPATIENRKEQPRSYMFKNSEGDTYTRNRFINVIPDIPDDEELSKASQIVREDDNHTILNESNFEIFNVPTQSSRGRPIKIPDRLKY